MEARRGETPDTGRRLDAQRDSLATRSGDAPCCFDQAYGPCATPKISGLGFQISGSINTSFLSRASA